MSLFEEAEAFMKKKNISVKTETDREEIIQKLRHEFDNATRLEIEKALDRIADLDINIQNFDLILKKVRIWLED